VARTQKPDLILLDANLPGVDGYTVCRLLKADPVLASTPVLFMTVRASLDDRLVGLMLGADDYLVKPVDMPELMVRIQILLARRVPAPGRSPGIGPHETPAR
jgi:DNA-binding response OmpR family regulator